MKVTDYQQLKLALNKADAIAAWIKEDCASENDKHKNTMNGKKYNMSFSTGALLKRESLLVSSIYSEIGEWNAVKKYVLEKNILQARTLSTLQSLYGEIASRLQTLSNDEIEFLNTSQGNEQGYALWVAICRKYKFIAEFAHEVVREKFLTFHDTVLFEDYSAFFNAKADWAPELESLSQSTQTKLRQVLFRILHEANLLSTDNRIIPVQCSQRMEAVFAGTNNFLFFPMQVTNGWSR